MRVAIVHYHFRKGGVTRVVEAALRALEARDVHVAVLAGEPPPEGTMLSERVIVVSGLGYREGFSTEAVNELETELRAAAQRALGGEPDLWHLHNTTLGKNRVWTACVAAMARTGVPLLLQLHDFAEDGRPENYRLLKTDLANARGGLEENLYPVGPNVRYATLNSRDRFRLLESGLAENAVSVLPNPVPSFPEDPTPWDLRKLGWERMILYPSRSIRRKNLGEVLYWSAGLDPGVGIGLTLDPENPSARPIYERWRALAAEWKAPIEFELGRREGVRFEGLVAAASAIMTTSVAEGFGLAFLEPWVAGKGIVGRDLPEITCDFRERGLALGGLYPELRVPVDWVGASALRERAKTRLTEAMACYGVDWDDAEFESTMAEWTHGDSVDFGRLDEPLQERVLGRVFEDPSLMATGRPQQLPLESTEDQIEENGRLVASAYGVEAYGDRLVGLYQSVEAGHGTDYLSPERVLNSFLRLENMSLLRV